MDSGAFLEIRITLVCLSQTHWPMHNHWEEEPLGDRMHTYSGWCVQSRRPVKTGRRQLEMRVQRPADLGGFLLCKKTALGKFVSFLWLPELDEATVTLFKLYYPKDPRP